MKIATAAAEQPTKSTRYRGGYPALRWLAKTDPEAALAVLHAMRDEACTYASERTSPAFLEARESSADDAGAFAVPDVAVTASTMGEAPDSRPTHDFERLHDIRPSVDEMFADVCRVRVTRFADGRVERHVGLGAVPQFDGVLARLAGMSFSFHSELVRGEGVGTMLSYTDDEGRQQTPQVVASKPRGGKRPHRTMGAVLAYLALSPAIPNPLDAKPIGRPFSGERALPDLYDPLPREEPAGGKPGRYGVEEARALLRRFGVDGSVPFDDARTAVGLGVVEKGVPVVANGARFVAGICGSKQTASSPAPVWQERQARSVDPVVEEVASRGNLTSIGHRLGFRGGYADRAGKRALLEVGRALVADNDNRQRKKFAA